MTRVDLAAQYTAEELADLTPDELAGMQDPDLYDGEGTAEADTDAVDTAPITQTAVLEPPAPARVDPDAQRRELDDLLAAANGIEPAPAPAAAAPLDVSAFEDVYRPRLPEFNYNPEAEVERLLAQKVELAKLHNDNDLDSVEFAQKSSAIDDQMMQARIAGNALKTGEQYWLGNTVKKFLEQPENQTFASSEILFSALDARVQAMQKGEYAADPFHPAILAIARKSVLEELGLAAPPAPTPAPAKKTAPPAAGPRQIPPTLGSVPSAGDEAVNANSALFSHLDRLEGEAHEEALAKLSPAQQAAYLQG